MGVTGRGIFAEDRHITCVKMSPEKADEVSSLLELMSEFID